MLAPLESPIEKSCATLWWKTFPVTSKWTKIPACRTDPHSTPPLPPAWRLWAAVELQGLFPPPRLVWHRDSLSHGSGAQVLPSSSPGLSRSWCQGSTRGERLPVEVRGSGGALQSCHGRDGEAWVGQEGSSGYRTGHSLHFLSHRSSGGKNQKRLWKPSSLTAMNHKTRDQLPAPRSPRQYSDLVVTCQHCLRYCHQATRPAVRID